MALAKDIVRKIKEAFVGEYRQEAKAADKKLGWLSTRSNIENFFASNTVILGTLGMWAFIATGTIVSTLPLAISLAAMTTLSAGAAIAGVVANTIVNNRMWKKLNEDYATGKLTQRYLDEVIPQQRAGLESIARNFNRNVSEFTEETRVIDKLEATVRDDLTLGKSFAAVAEKPKTALGRFWRGTGTFLRDLKPV